MRRDSRSLRTVALALAGVLVLVLVLAQLLLPRLAASEISSRIGRYGSVRSVSVSAWPAVKLLWGSADSVHVDATRLALEPSQATKLLSEAHGVQNMDVHASVVRVGSLALSDATLSKRGSHLTGAASVAATAVPAALPAGIEDVQLRHSAGGQVEVSARGSLLGVSASVDAVALARGGALVAHPLGLLLEGLQLTLFSDPHLYIEGVAATPTQPPPIGYRLTMSARLR